MRPKIRWHGVMPATTTPFRPEGTVDHERAAAQVVRMVDAGCTAIVPHGSLGEGSTLTFDEKCELQRTCVRAAAGRVPIIPGIAALSTREAVDLAQAARENGCSGLMVLPPYQYSTDWREMRAHVGDVMRATDLPCLLYNNPVAYKTDFVPEQVAELAAEHANLEAVKESSTDVRRVTAIRALLGSRVALGVGVDDALVEGVAAGATFWIAGLVNAFPLESVRLMELAKLAAEEGGPVAELDELYAWFLPLLRLDTVPKFVQLIKLAEEAVGIGSERVRPPRLILTGGERTQALALIQHALDTRPQMGQIG